MKYIIANWKMSFDSTEIKTWLKYFKPDSKNEIILAPSYPFFTEIKDYPLAAQNISEYPEGPYTGSVAANQLKEYCKYCIVGHSEIGDNLEQKLKKATLCMENGLIPIICFVDTTELGQLSQKGVILAWEDPSSISKGAPFKKLDLGEIQNTVVKIKEQTKNIPLLYGGSVNRQNSLSLVKMGVDGVLVGQASLDPLHFLDIVHAFEV